MQILPLMRPSRGRSSRAGFTLIEILLVVVIISALAAMVVPRLTGRSEKARESIARTDITANVPTALKLYELDNGNFPSSAQGLNALLVKPSGEPIPQNWNGPYIERKTILDPWGREYQYRYPSTHGTDYDLYSLGKAGKDDENVIANWK